MAIFQLVLQLVDHSLEDQPPVPLFLAQILNLPQLLQLVNLDYLVAEVYSDPLVKQLEAVFLEIQQGAPVYLEIHHHLACLVHLHHCSMVRIHCSRLQLMQIMTRKRVAEMMKTTLAMEAIVLLLIKLEKLALIQNLSNLILNLDHQKRVLIQKSST